MLLLAADLFGSASFSRSLCKCFLITKSHILTNFHPRLNARLFPLSNLFIIYVLRLDLPDEALAGTNSCTRFPGNTQVLNMVKYV